MLLVVQVARGPSLLLPIVGWAGFGICDPMCLASLSTEPSCTTCALAFFAPTP